MDTKKRCMKETTCTWDKVAKKCVDYVAFDGTNCEVFDNHYHACRKASKTSGCIWTGNKKVGTCASPIVPATTAAKLFLGMTCNPNDDKCDHVGGVACNEVTQECAWTNGFSCLLHNKCATNYCDLEFNLCSDKKNNGEQCLDPLECKSGTCFNLACI